MPGTKPLVHCTAVIPVSTKILLRSGLPTAGFSRHGLDTINTVSTISSMFIGRKSKPSSVSSLKPKKVL